MAFSGHPCIHALYRAKLDFAGILAVDGYLYSRGMSSNIQGVVTTLYLQLFLSKDSNGYLRGPYN